MLSAGVKKALPQIEKVVEAMIVALKNGGRGCVSSKQELLVEQVLSMR